MLRMLFKSCLFCCFIFYPFLAIAQDTSSFNQYVTIHRAYRGHHVLIPSGLGVNISFWETGERIHRIWLDDLTELVIDVDQPLPDARIIHIKRISELSIPLQVRSKSKSKTLMTVVTDQRIYQFILIPVLDSSVQTIHIIPDRNPILEIDNVTIARLSHVENGLEQAIAQKRMLPDSPLVVKVREFVIAARRGVPIPQAAQEQGLLLSFIHELAKIGLKTPARPFLQPRN